jgi:hypothetical protein
VELLRRRSLGVATFLILEKQKGLAGQMNEAVQTPEGKELEIGCICSAAVTVAGPVRYCSNRTVKVLTPLKHNLSHSFSRVLGSSCVVLTISRLHLGVDCAVAWAAEQRACCIVVCAGAPRLFDLVNVSDSKLRLAFW